MNAALPIIRYDAMVHAITECHSVDEVKDIRDKAMALEIYARQAMNVDAERKATEIRLRAERRTGELLRELPRADHNRGNQHSAISNDATQPSDYASALDRTGISRQRAQRYQELANVPGKVFEQHLADTEQRPTTNGILRAVNGATKMDDGSLWIWGRLRDFERDSYTERDAAELYGGMTETMQADVRRILPSIIGWLNDLQECAQ